MDEPTHNIESIAISIWMALASLNLDAVKDFISKMHSRYPTIFTDNGIEYIMVTTLVLTTITSMIIRLFYKMTGITTAIWETDEEPKTIQERITQILYHPYNEVTNLSKSIFYTTIFCSAFIFFIYTLMYDRGFYYKYIFRLISYLISIPTIFIANVSYYSINIMRFY